MQLHGASSFRKDFIMASTIGCTTCGHKNGAKSKFCEECGAKLESVPAASGKKKKAAVDEQIRPKTEVAPPPSKAETTEKAEETEREARPRTEVVDPPSRAKGEKRAAPKTQVVSPLGSFDLLYPNGQRITFKEEEEYYVGRTDPANDWYPAVDLAPHGGEPGGVGRKHARFIYDQGVHKLEDLGSINGSFVNNSRIKKNEPQPLKAGDEVRFGRVQVTFLEAER